MTRVAKIAKLVGWPHWCREIHYLGEGGPLPMTADNSPELWRPDIDLNHAIQAAEMRWPKMDFSLDLLHYSWGPRWEFQLHGDPGQAAHADTPCEAICRAIEAAGAKE